MICRGPVTQWQVADELVAEGHWESLPAFLRRFRRYGPLAWPAPALIRDAVVELIELTVHVPEGLDELRRRAAIPRRPSIDWLLPTVVEQLIGYRFWLAATAKADTGGGG